MGSSAISPQLTTTTPISSFTVGTTPEGEVTFDSLKGKYKALKREIEAIKASKGITSRYSTLGAYFDDFIKGFTNFFEPGSGDLIDVQANTGEVYAAVQACFDQLQEVIDNFDSIWQSYSDFLEFINSDFNLKTSDKHKLEYALTNFLDEFIKKTFPKESIFDELNQLALGHDLETDSFLLRSNSLATIQASIQKLADDVISQLETKDLGKLTFQSLIEFINESTNKYHLITEIEENLAAGLRDSLIRIKFKVTTEFNNSRSDFQNTTVSFTSLEISNLKLSDETNLKLNEIATNFESNSVYEDEGLNFSSFRKGINQGNVFQIKDFLERIYNLITSKSGEKSAGEQHFLKAYDALLADIEKIINRVNEISGNALDLKSSPILSQPDKYLSHILKKLNYSTEDLNMFISSLIRDEKNDFDIDNYLKASHELNQWFQSIVEKYNFLSEQYNSEYNSANAAVDKFDLKKNYISVLQKIVKGQFGVRLGEKFKAAKHTIFGFLTSAQKSLTSFFDSRKSAVESRVVKVESKIESEKEKQLNLLKQSLSEHQIKEDMNQQELMDMLSQLEDINYAEIENYVIALLISINTSSEIKEFVGSFQDFKKQLLAKRQQVLLMLINIAGAGLAKITHQQISSAMTEEELTSLRQARDLISECTIKLQVIAHKLNTLDDSFGQAV